MEKVLIVNADQCTGCKVCELTCSMAKFGEFNPRKSYIKVLRNKLMDVNIVALSPKCDQCNQCVDACLPNAIYFVDMDNAIVEWKGVKIGRFPAPLIGGA